MNRVQALTAAALVALAATGCAGNRAKTAAVQPERVKLEVPFYADDAKFGGPSTLASVLTFWDRYTEPKDLVQEAYDTKIKGTLPVDLLLAAQERGMQARSFQAGLKDVKDELKLGHPVVAYIGGRFVVVTGFDDGKQGFFVNSGRESDRFVGYGSFLSRWKKTGSWAILVMPAGEPSMSDRSARAE